MWRRPVCSCLEGRKSPDPRRQAQGTCRVQVLPPICVFADGRRGPGPSVREPGHVSGRRSLGAGPAGWFQGMCAEVTSQVSHL